MRESITNNLNVFSKSVGFTARLIKTCRRRIQRSTDKLLNEIQSQPFYRTYMRSVVSDIQVTFYEGLSARAVRYLRKHNDMNWLKGNENTTFLFVLVKGWYAGFARLVRYKDRPEFGTGIWLMDCGLRPVFRGLGAGERLVASTIEYARDMYAGELTLFVFKDNLRAMNLYKKLGLVETDIPELNGKVLKGCRKPHIFMRIILNS